MKNIHIIPTDKPSRLCKDEFGKFYVTELMESKISFFKNQHIYITSNEEIKDVRPHKGKWQLEQGQILNKFPNYLTDLSECKLVIMTTNQDLIKDGVQAIDDEFLEWFVKNPSCEKVEVENSGPGFPAGIYFINYLPEHFVQETTIPKEETYVEKGLDYMIDLKEPKQETLEEITEQIQKDCHKFVESIISKVTYQDATNTFLFMKLAELTLKLKKYE